MVHFEINAADPQAAGRFYTQVFGWQIEKWAGPVDYWLVTTGDKGSAGIDGGIQKTEAPFSGTTNIIQVDSLDPMLAKIQKSGGKVIRPKHAVPGVGWAAYAEDPQGNLFGLMQNDPGAR